jgi:hypothetical protein
VWFGDDFEPYIDMNVSELVKKDSKYAHSDISLFGSPNVSDL